MKLLLALLLFCVAFADDEESATEHSIYLDYAERFDGRLDLIDLKIEELRRVLYGLSAQSEF
jgi:hypothetical protein